MKIILCVVALALFGLASAGHHHGQDHPLTETTKDFFQGEWYAVNFSPESIKNKKCCLPVENIRFSDKSKHLHLTATKWVGARCSGAQDEVEPFSKVSADVTFAQLSPMHVSSNNGVQIDVKEAQLDSIHQSTHNQKVTFELSLSYKFSGGEKCSMTLSKVDTPHIKNEASLWSLSNNGMYHQESLDFGFLGRDTQAQETAADDFEAIKSLFGEFVRRTTGKDIFWD